MKKSISVLLKVAFWVVFLHNTGVLKQLSFDFSSKISREQQIKGERFQYAFLEKELQKAEKDEQAGIRYSPYTYFATVERLYQIQDSIGFRPFETQTIQLQRLLNGSISDKVYSYDDVARAREKFKKTLTPEQPDVSTFSRREIANWWKSLYLHMLPFVFLLFLLWIREGKYSSILSLKSPFCFIIALLLHPILIGWSVYRWWKNTGKGFIAETEIRRRKKNLFAKLSEEERVLIDHFVKSKVSFKLFLKQASIFGHKQHSIGTALVAVLICVITAQTRGQQAQMPQCVSYSVQSTLQHGPLVTLEVDVGTVHDSCWYEMVLLDDGRWCPRFHLVHTAKNMLFILSKGYWKNQEPIPIWILNSNSTMPSIEYHIQSFKK